jgi:8-oxo-dGTP pyrophosphatase MutT (NUDIX family)
VSRDEIVTIVDRDNVVIGEASRAQMRRQGLCHRATYILVFDLAGRLFVQKRTLSKDIYPGYYDVAAGGVVLAGETYEESAERELAEELGIRQVPLRRHFDFYHRDGTNQVWGRVYDCRFDGEMVLQEEEIESGCFYPVPAVLDLSRSKPFTPDGLYVLRRYYQTYAIGDHT